MNVGSNAGTYFARSYGVSRSGSTVTKRTCNRSPSLPSFSFTAFISSPDGWSVLVAYLAGMAGMLSLTSAKSGALVGVLISVTTIPAAANIGVAAALGNWADWRGAMAQLSINLVGIVLAGVLTLRLERGLYERRRQRHLGDESRVAAGLPGAPPKSRGR